ncbi:oxidoreductase [Arsenicibacter rosenii]|uniref:Oxidoreductase n=1 Tax=Arsenicibacter rosenii TaxID=1750698 RepID=A0A1S2VDV3_9BACT|nr:oxidoreductase [Arsenicibacter rosenii]OIN56947.1 oxidoreductase [Arsenicibacter rosenii]
MPSPITVGLIGFGLSGRYFHAPFLHTNPNFTLTKVVERHRNDAQLFDPSIVTVRSHEALYSDPDIDLVIVGSPNDTHFSYAKAALEAGKHVLIEKPFTNTSAQARELLDLAQAKGLVAIPYQNRRYDADFLTIRQVLASGKLGEINEYEGHFDRYRPVVLDSWKEHEPDGGGNLYNLGPHLLDQAIVLFGLPEAVSGDIRMIRQGSTNDDYFEIRLFYPDKRVIVKSNMMAPENHLRYIIHGSAGSFVKSGLDIQEETQRKDILPDTPDWGHEPASQYGTLTTEAGRETIESVAGNYHTFYNNLAAAIRGEQPAEVRPEQIYAVIRIMELARQSSQEGRVLAFD